MGYIDRSAKNTNSKPVMEKKAICLRRVKSERRMTVNPVTLVKKLVITAERILFIDARAELVLCSSTKKCNR
jgi:hypothetical protein